MALGYVAITLWQSRPGKTGDSVVDPTAQEPRRPVPEILLAMLVIIFAGIATPTEAAAFGAITSIIIAFTAGRFKVKDLYAAGISSVRITGTIFILVMASTLYSQIMAYMGATTGLVRWVGASIVNGALMMLLIVATLQIGNISPPFGMGLFVMKSSAPWLPILTIYRAALPWIISDLIIILILCLFPVLVTFLPALMAQ